MLLLPAMIRGGGVWRRRGSPMGIERCGLKLVRWRMLT